MDDNLVRLAREIVAYRARNPKMYEEYKNSSRYGLLIRIAELIAEIGEGRKEKKIRGLFPG